MYDDDMLRIRHIFDAAEKVRNFIQNKSRENLNSDDMLLFALVRAIEIIGEAARYISDDFKNNHPEIPWLDIMGMRNRLIHGYFDLDLDVVWKTSTRNIPALIEQLEKIADVNDL
ncbi:MAG: DUF86 domain-containing protein [Candidatus Latescibacteria bacterium]|nr:DUF86 domain-containing protein [Candidatus Latescibacterota bacterium]